MRGPAAINSQDNKPLQYSIKIKTVKKIFRLMATALALTAWSATAVAATLTEGFETKTTGSYNTTSVQGDACVWTLSDAGVFADKTNSNSGNNSLRLGNTAASYANMNANKSGGAGTVTFYGRKWSASEAEATVAVQYSTNSGSTWTTAGKVTISSMTYTKYSVNVNASGNVRIKFLQTAGKRALIDDVSVSDYSGGSSTSASISSPANNSTVDFGTVDANTTKTMSVVVKGTGLTEAVSVAVSGTGFTANTTSLSASKVNSTAGATVQLNFKSASGGSYSGTLTLKTGSTTIKVNLKATVSGSTPSTGGITSPANGSTVDFGTVSASTTKTMQVAVKGSGLTSAVSVAVSGTGFAANTTSLSASKVNSTTGATLQLNFKGASADTYTGTLTLKNGSTTIKVNLKATVSGGGSTPVTAGITSPAAGSTVDFGTVTAGKNKTTYVPVIGTGLTEAVTVAVTGTGFRTGTTSLSASKVNSSTGAQLQLIFNSASAGTFKGTLTLTNGSSTRKIALKATVSGAGSTAQPESDDPTTPSGGGSTGTSQTGATNNNIPSGYYSAAEGKCGKELLSALCKIVASHTSVSYAKLWTSYQKTDTKSNGKIWDMYSTKEFTYKTDQCGNYTSIGVCYNREHSFPKSWFKDATPMYTDLFHIYPTDGFVNNQRGNAPFGECKNGTYVASKNSVSAKGKLGKSTLSGYTGTVWEPDDDYKGDFARSYFYMVTAYNTKVAGWTSDMLNKTTYPAFATWAQDMLLNCNALDPVSTKETTRQEAVYGIQKNRNPFIDYPDLADYIWGSKKTTPWSASAPKSTVISQPANGATLNFGTVATGATNEKIVAVKGASVKDNVSVSVRGNGFNASAEWLDADAVNANGSAAAKAPSRAAAAADEEDSAGALLKITFMVPNQSNYSGTLTLTTGSVTNTVTLEGKALDGLPAAEAENIEAQEFTARWVNVGDELPGGYYRLDVTDDGVSLPGYPRNVDAEALTYEVTGLSPEHSYEYSLSNATTQSNIIAVTTDRLKPVFEYDIIDDDTHMITTPGKPSESIGIDVLTENVTGDITFSVQAPFEVSADNVNWARQAVVAAEAGQVYVRLGATEVDGEYLSSLRAVTGDFTDDAVTLQGEVTSTGNTVYFMEDFEADATGMNAYATKTYNGNGSTWTLTQALLQTQPDNQVFYDGTYSLRLGDSTKDVNVEMQEDRILPNSTITFYATKWNKASEADATLTLEYSADQGATWQPVHTVTINTIATTPAEYTMVKASLNNVSNGRIRITKAAGNGGRVHIDNIMATRDSSGAESLASDSNSWKVYTAATGEITVSVAEPTPVTIVGIDGTVYHSATVATDATVAVPAGQLYLISAPGHITRRLIP